MSTINFRPDTFGLSKDLTLVGEGPSIRRAKERGNPRLRQAMLEAKVILESAWGGDKIAVQRINEAITTSDLFKSAVGAVMDREMLKAYETESPDWSPYAALTKVKDFKPKTLVELAVPSGPLAKVPERTNYPIGSTSAAERQISVGKVGEGYGYTLEARVNDDIGELAIVPQTWAARARTTEANLALQQLANTLTGAPNTGLFNAPNKNIYTGPLTADNLQAMYTAARSTRRDANGNLLVAPQMQLVVGPALEFVAKRIINTQEIKVTVGSTTTTESNPFAGIKLTVLPDLVGSAWFLLPVPKQGVKNAIYLAKLLGFETPDIRVKADQGMSVGGGSISPLDGGFDDDTIWYRVRHIAGAAQGDPTFAVASDGAGAAGSALAKVGW